MGASGIEAIEGLQSQLAPAPPSGPATAAPGFVDRLEEELGGLNAQLVAAEQGVQKLAAGTAANLHDVMLQLEQARLALQLASQVRSRVLEAYQDVMRMQV